MSQQPVSFLTLPGEIRTRIYEMLFESLQQPQPRVCDSIPSMPRRPIKTKHDIETAILRVSRFVGSEAMYTLVQQNHFVHVHISLSKFVAVFIDMRAPVLTTKRRAVDNFRGYSASFTVTENGTSRGQEAPGETRFSAMMRLQDLDRVCHSLGNADAVHRALPSQTTHEVVIHQPQHSPEPTLAQQERLLEPFRRRLRGLKHFSIQGCVDSWLAASVVAHVSSGYLSPDPDEVLASLQAHKQAGNECFRGGSAQLASSSWAKGGYLIDMHQQGPHWDTLVRSSPTFLAEVHELRFKLLLNLAQVCLQVAEEAPDDTPLKPSLFQTTEVYLDDAMLRARETVAEQAASSGKVTWRPSPEQMAKLWYRKARINRLTNNLAFAYEAIQVAKEACPNDGAIRRELETIVELMGRQLYTA